MKPKLVSSKNCFDNTQNVRKIITILLSDWIICKTLMSKNSSVAITVIL